MTLTARDLHLPNGSATAAGPAGAAGSVSFAVDVGPARAGWTHCGLRVLALEVGASCDLHTGATEMVLVPLAGGCAVTVDEQTYHLHGRESVFTGVTDTLYVPQGSAISVTSEGGGRFALATAVCERKRPVAYLPADDVPVELRGAGQASRQVNNFGTPAVLDADRLIVCEVLTPAGNWSSWPPHKHDEDREGESVLEEIYYFEVADGPAGGVPGGGAPRGFGYQRVYGHEHSDVDVLAEVRTGDVVLIPHGWHGPSMAAPGYDLYYLNVMAGPGERVWEICDDPTHAWVRSGWESQLIDPRLPLTSAPSSEGAAGGVTL